MEDPVAKMRQRIQRYWFVDGLNELSLGILILGIGLLYGISSRLNELDLGWLVPIGQVVLILASTWLLGRAVRFLKERLTYPRTGYVAYPPKQGRDRVLRAVISGGIALAISAFVATIARLPSLNNWLPLVSGTLAAFGLLWIGYRFDLTRFYLLAAYAVAAGWGASIAPLDTDQEFTIYFCLLGVGLMASGGLTLLRYIQSTRPSSGGEA